MNLQATYDTGLNLQDALTSAVKSGMFKVVPRSDEAVHVMLYPLHHQGAKIQLLNRASNVWCENLGHLHELEDLLNECLGNNACPKPFGGARQVRIGGSRPAYYTSQKEVEGMLMRIRYPLDIQPDEFNNFVKCVFGTYCEGEEIVIPALAQITGLDEEKVEKYLEFMAMLKFTHMKPPKRRLEKVFYIGCTPEEEFAAWVESAGGNFASRGYFRRTRILENFRTNILEREPLLKIREGKPLLRIFLERVASLNDRPLL